MTMKRFFITRFVFTLIALLSFHQAAHAVDSPLATPLRVGLSIGTLRFSGAALTADTGPLFTESLTLGGELYGLRLIGVRALLWEKPQSMRGFHGGGKLLLGFGPQLAVEPSAELGWSHRFRNDVDLGVGVDLVLGEYLGGSFKLSCGYLLR